MKPKTEELLYFLLWTCDLLWRPTWRNLTGSYEGWAYRNGFLRELQRLEKAQWLERKPCRSGDRIYRLTEAGRLHALGGRDPAERWNRRWDGRWRLVIFDVPVERNSVRNKLRRFLYSHGFGCLQQSVWITPDPVEELRPLLSGAPADVGTLIVLEAHPCAGESDGELIAAAWDFAAINRQYLSYLEVLSECPDQRLIAQGATAELRRWFERERQGWQQALERDPLLPGCLLPKDYLGRDAWQRRIKVMRDAGLGLRTLEVRDNN